MRRFAAIAHLYKDSYAIVRHRHDRLAVQTVSEEQTRPKAGYRLVSASSTPLPHKGFSRNVKPMEVHFNPDLQAMLDELATETGRPPGELVKDALLGYLDELAQTREALNSRYDGLKSGRVNPIPGDEVIARLREKSAARRSPPGS